MASVAMSMPVCYASQKRALSQHQPNPEALFFKPLPVTVSLSKPESSRAERVRVEASLKERAVTGLTAAAVTASVVIPDVAMAAEAGTLTPSLKNFLLSIAAGGVVLIAIIGAVVGVSNFDPVNRS